MTLRKLYCSSACQALSAVHLISRHKKVRKSINILSLYCYSAVCLLCGDCKAGLVLQKGIQEGSWLGPVVCETCVFPVEGKGKTRKVGPSDSVYDYLSKGTLYISQRCSSPWVLDYGVGVANAFQFWVSKWELGQWKGEEGWSLRH